MTWLIILSLVNMLVVAIAVLVHFEALFVLSRVVPKIHANHRVRILAGVAGVLLAHVLEVWVFAIAYYVLISKLGWGSLEGNFDGSLLDCFYFSFTSFTTLGFGDIEPLGPVRYLTGTESLTGLLLITWSASFIYLAMQRYWGEDG